MVDGRGIVALLAVCLCAGSVWADARVRGDAGVAVEIFSDEPDRVWVAVDRDADGAPEGLYGFVSRKVALPHELLALLPVELRSANVQVSEQRLFVEDARSGQTWTLSIDPADGRERAEVVRRGRAIEVTLANGAALGSYDLTVPHPDAPGGRGLENSRGVRERIVPRLELVPTGLTSPASTPGTPPPCPNCASGGQGAAACSAQCSAGLSAGGSGFTFGGNGAVNLSAGCNVSCGEGYFACCNCSPSALGTLGNLAGCRCIRAICR